MPNLRKSPFSTDFYSFFSLRIFIVFSVYGIKKLSMAESTDFFSYSIWLLPPPPPTALAVFYGRKNDFWTSLLAGQISFSQIIFLLAKS